MRHKRRGQRFPRVGGLSLLHFQKLEWFVCGVKANKGSRTTQEIMRFLARFQSPSVEYELLFRKCFNNLLLLPCQKLLNCSVCIMFVSSLKSIKKADSDRSAKRTWVIIVEDASFSSCPCLFAFIHNMRCICLFNLFFYELLVKPKTHKYLDHKHESAALTSGGHHSLMMRQMTITKTVHLARRL